MANPKNYTKISAKLGILEADAGTYLSKIALSFGSSLIFATLFDARG
jgi:hypothetical protein